MKSVLTLCLISAMVSSSFAQQAAETTGNAGGLPAFSQRTRVLSLGLGFPHLYRIGYEVPAGYTHLKTTGFGPLYAKFELPATDHIGLVTSLGYGTFHYSYFGYSPQVVHYDDVNTFALSLSANYHFSHWVRSPRADIYAGAGLSVDYQKYSYGNIPPYRPSENKAHIYPLFRVGARYYPGQNFGVFGEAGYDGLSIVQLGFCLKL